MTASIDFDRGCPGFAPTSVELIDLEDDPNPLSITVTMTSPGWEREQHSEPAADGGLPHLAGLAWVAPYDFKGSHVSFGDGASHYLAAEIAPRFLHGHFEMGVSHERDSPSSYVYARATGDQGSNLLFDCESYEIPIDGAGYPSKPDGFDLHCTVQLYVGSESSYQECVEGDGTVHMKTP